MKLNFNRALVDLDGNNIPASNLGKLLAQLMASQTKGDPFKFWEWSMAMHKGEVIDLDTSDQKTLQEFIKSNEQLTILAKAQALQIFEEKEEKEKNKHGI
jgi:uncharacterized protein YecA (UPF0149 family)